MSKFHPLQSLALISLLITLLFVPCVAVGGTVQTVEPVPWGPSPVLLNNPKTGEPNALWIQAEKILHSRWTAEGWSDPVGVSMGQSVAGAYGSDGTLHVGFTIEVYGIWEMYYTSLLPDKVEWPGITHVGTAAGQPYNLQMLVSPTQEPHLVWEVAESIWHSWRKFRGTWSYPLKVSYGHQSDAQFGPDGVLHLVFVHAFIGDTALYYTQWEGSTWTFPWWVIHNPGQEQNPRVSVTGNGVVHVTWQDSSSGDWMVYKALKLSSGVFLKYPLPDGKGVTPDILANGRGEWVVWQDLHEGSHMVLVHYPDRNMRLTVQNTLQDPVTHLRLEPWPGDERGVRIRWEDSANVSWYCDGWFDEEGNTRMGHVLQWPGELPFPTVRVTRTFLPVIAVS